MQNKEAQGGGSLHDSQPNHNQPNPLESRGPHQRGVRKSARNRSGAAGSLGAPPEATEPTARVGAAVAGRPPVRPKSVGCSIGRRDTRSCVSERLLGTRNRDQSVLLDLGSREQRHPPPAPGHPPRHDALRLLSVEAVEVLAALTAGGALLREWAFFVLGCD